MRQINFDDVLQTSSTRGGAQLGERAMTPDGRVFVYVKDSGSGIQAGGVAVPAAVTTVTSLTASVADSAGQYTTIVKASAGWTVGAFQNAWVLVNAGTGTGQVAKVKDNTADTLILYPAYALSTALDTTSGCAIWTPYLVQKSAITVKVQNATGVMQTALTASYYGWAQRCGLGRVVAGEVLVIGESFVTGDDTTGQVVKGTTAKGPFDEEMIGICVVANSAVDVGALVDFKMAV